MCNLLDEGILWDFDICVWVIFRPFFSTGVTSTSQSVVTFVADHSTCVLTHTYTLSQTHTHTLSLSLSLSHIHAHSLSLSRIHTAHKSLTTLHHTKLWEPKQLLRHYERLNEFSLKKIIIPCFTINHKLGWQVISVYELT